MSSRSSRPTVGGSPSAASTSDSAARSGRGRLRRQHRRHRASARSSRPRRARAPGLVSRRALDRVFGIGPEYIDAAGPRSAVVGPSRGRGLHVLLAPTAQLGFFKPTWSPDGAQLLMGCFDERVGRDRLCASTADGERVRVLPLGVAAGELPGLGSAATMTRRIGSPRRPLVVVLSGSCRTAGRRRGRRRAAAAAPPAGRRASCR